MPEGLSVELTPLAFLVGSWQGAGVVSSRFVSAVAEPVEHKIIQNVTFSVESANYLTYHASSRLIDMDGNPGLELPAELGFWRLARPAERGDHGPALLPGSGDISIKTAEDLERLRNANGGFDIEASIIHSGGAYEVYAGQVAKGRIDIRTVAGSHMPYHLVEAGKSWGYAERMYGTLTKEGITKLLWVQEVAASVRDEPVPLVSVELDRIG